MLCQTPVPAHAQPQLIEQLKLRGEAPAESANKQALYQMLRDVMVTERIALLGEARAAADGRVSEGSVLSAAAGYVPTEEDLKVLAEPLPSDLYKLSIAKVPRCLACSLPGSVY